MNPSEASSLPQSPELTSLFASNSQYTTDPNHHKPDDKDLDDMTSVQSCGKEGGGVVTACTSAPPPTALQSGLADKRSDRTYQENFHE